MGKASKRRKEKRENKPDSTSIENSAALFKLLSEITASSSDSNETRLFTVHQTSNTESPYEIEPIAIIKSQSNEEYIEENWTEIASSSWTGYLQKGKGAVVIPPLDKRNSDQFAGKYFSVDELKEEVKVSDQEQIFSDYQPESQVLLLIEEAEERIHAYKLNRSPVMEHQKKIEDDRDAHEFRTPDAPMPLGGDTVEKQKKYLYESWGQLSALAWEQYRESERGVVYVAAQLADIVANKTPVSYITRTALLENYGNKDWIDGIKTMLKNYDPEQEVVFLLEQTDGGISGYQLRSWPTPTEAFELHTEAQLNGTHDLGLIYLHYFDVILDFCYEIIQSVQNHIEDTRFVDVQQLATKLLSHASSLLQMTRNPDLLVHRMQNDDDIVDFSSVIVLGRVALETYVTMFEVFFEPTIDDEFEFQHAFWILSGYIFAENYPVEDIGVKHRSAVARTIADMQRQRIQQTQKFATYTPKQQKQLLEGNLTRNWKTVANAAGFGEVTLKKIYAQQSGYIHADGLSGQQLESATKKDIDLYLDAVMFTVLTVLCKMIVNYAIKFKEAKQICEEYPDIYRLAENISKMASEMD